MIKYFFVRAPINIHFPENKFLVHVLKVASKVEMHDYYILPKIIFVYNRQVFKWKTHFNLKMIQLEMSIN